MKLHPKIQALRNKVGHIPFHTFNPAEKQYSLLPLEQRVAVSSKPEDDDSRLIKQYFAIFGVPDDYGTVPVKGCFAKSLNDRGPQSTSTYKIPVLWQHKQDDPLCIPLVLKEDEIGLYGEYEPDPIPSGDRCVIQVKRGTINQGSYGFNYIWDKMKFDDKTDLIYMYEVNLLEVSPVTIGSQTETFVKRNSNGLFVDEFLEDETEDFIKKLPRKFHLEARSLITRHISLALMQPNNQTQRNSLKKDKPSKRGIDYEYIINNLKI